MGNVIVVGGGPIGLTSAMLLARAGHEVTVFEKDPSDTPSSAFDAWDRWERSGVAQFRLAHYMQAKFRHLLDAELPEVRDEIAACGGLRHNMLCALPSTIHDAPRPDDDRFETLTARRPVLEHAFARVAQNSAGVKIVRGVAVDGPLTDGSLGDGIPHVVGVRTKDGHEHRADLVIDAMGRRSRFGEWVTAMGGRPPEEEAIDAGFAYYSRYFRSRTGGLPEVAGPFPMTSLSTFGVLSVPADNDTWVLGVICAAGDKPLKAARRNDVWERVVRSVPHLVHWVDDGEPLHDVQPMAGVADRYRRFVVDGTPVVTGMVAVGDAWACTNPQAGRGISTGLSHAVALRDVVREHLDDPRTLAEAFDDRTEERCTPWYRAQVDRDHARYAAVEAAIEGREPPRPREDDIVAQVQAAWATAAVYDADVGRAFLEIMSCLSLPTEIAARDGFIDKVFAVASGREPPPHPGPTRAELLALLN